MEIGTVVKISGLNSVTVKIVHDVVDSLYGRKIKKYKKIMAHDLIGVRLGDKVKLESCSPVSKKKKHIVKEKV